MFVLTEYKPWKSECMRKERNTWLLLKRLADDDLLNRFDDEQQLQLRSLSRLFVILFFGFVFFLLRFSSSFQFTCHAFFLDLFSSSFVFVVPFCFVLCFVLICSCGLYFVKLFFACGAVWCRVD
jgi:hypothetical protein